MRSENPQQKKSTDHASDIWDLHLVRYEQQSAQSASLLYNDIMEYGMSLPKSNSFLTQQTATKIQKTLANYSHCCQVIFICQFGCAILLRKQREEDKVVIDLIFPVAWTLGSTVGRNEQSSSKGELMFPDYPLATQNLTIGKLDMLDQSLQSVCSDFVNTLNGCLSGALRSQKDGNKKKNHHTPSWMRQLLLQCIRRVIASYQHNQTTQQISNPNYNGYQVAGTLKRKTEQTQNLNILSKGGSLDVGQHTGITRPTTSVPVAYSVIEYYLREQNDDDNQIFKLFSLSYQLNLLSVIGQKQSSQKFLYELRKILWKVKVLNKNGAQFDEKKLTAMVQSAVSYRDQSQHKTFTLTQLQSDYQRLVNYNKSKQVYSAVCKKQSDRKVLKTMINYNSKLGTSTEWELLINQDSKTPFSELIAAKQHIAEQKWILIAQKIVFKLALNFRLGNPLNISLDQIKKPNNSLLSVIKIYQTRIKNQLPYRRCIGSKNQQESHLHLFKLIGCIVSFELVRNNRRNMHSNLQPHRIPYDDVQKFFQKFSSLSFEARQAMQSVMDYLKQQKYKNKIFQLAGNFDSYSEFALKAYSQTLSMQTWHQQMRAWLEDRKKNLGVKIKLHRQKIASVQRQIVLLAAQPCYCTTREQTRWGRYGSYTVQVPVTCSRCIRKKQKESQEARLKKETQPYIMAKIPNDLDSQKIFAFMSKMPSQIQGMVKIFYYLYGIKPNSSNENKYRQNIFDTSYGVLLPYGPCRKSQSFTKYLYDQKDVHKLVLYPTSDVYFVYQYSITPNKFDPDLFMLKTKDTIIDMVANDPDNYHSSKSQLRQHQIYAKMEQASKFKLKTEEYVNICEVRVAIKTQLSVLCQNLLHRNINLDIFKSQNLQIRWQTMVRTAGSLFAQKFSINSRQTPQIVADAIIQVLENYHINWSYTEINSLVFMGPFMSMFSQYFPTSQQEGPLMLLKCAHKQFLKLDNDLREDEKKLVQVRSRQAFISFSALCCLTQKVLNQNTTDQNQLFVFFIVLGYSCTVFMNQNRYKNERSGLMKKFSYLTDRSKFKNLKATLQYFKKYPNFLNKIVSIVDENCTQQTKWQHYQKYGNYTFRGLISIQNKITQYLVNIETGILLKNGKQLTGLSNKIKENKYYKQIFGDRDFEIYHSDQYSRTKRAFKDLLPDGETNTSIFFQFKQSNFEDRISIRMIQKRKENQIVGQEEFTLIYRQDLQTLNFTIHPLYKEGSLAWYSQKSSCIIFRSPQLELLKQIQMIIFLKKGTFAIEKGVLISNQYRNQSLRTIIKIKQKQGFEEIILKEKGYNHTAQSLAYKILFQLENPLYIIELRSSKATKFWLHRYDLIFKLQKQRLEVEGYGNYSVDFTYESNEYTPWDKNDNVKCIWLKKYNETIINSMQHSNILLMPNLRIDIFGKMALPEGYNTKITIFQYDLHEHFKDIRGRTSQANLFMTLVLISLRKYKRTPSISMTLNQYCQRLLRSCYNTRPLTSYQISTVRCILYHASENRNSSVLLSCEVLLQCSKFFLGNLYNQQKNSINIIIDQYRSNFSVARQNYLKQANYLNPIQRLDQMERQVLRIKQENIRAVRLQKKWSQKYPVAIKISAKKLQQVQDKYKYNVQSLKKFYQSLYNTKNEIKDSNIEKQIQSKLNNIFDKQQGKKGEHLMLQEMISQQKKSNQSCIKILKINEKMDLVKQKQKYITERDILEQIFINSKQQIQKIIEEINQNIKGSVDILSQLYPKLSIVHYSTLLCQGSSYLKLFFPNSTQTQHQMLIQIVDMWMRITVQLDSLKRLKFILAEGQDKRAVRREILSPREQIVGFKPWVCFEAQMRIKIWVSQYKTYKDLAESPNRSYSQLNMGQGKTQVIIPMFVLRKLYAKNIQDKALPRINLLSSLIEESKSNYFRFFSATSFRIPCIQIPFNRTIDLNQQNLRAIKGGLKVFIPWSLIVWDRQSCLSMTLKIRQLNQLAYNQKQRVSQFLSYEKQRWLFEQAKIFDIFDEVDALMSPKKSFVYAIGGSSSLPQAHTRIQLCRLILQIIVKQLLESSFEQEIISCQSVEQLIKINREGSFPIFRYIATGNEKKTTEFRKKIIQLLFSKKYIPDNFYFYEGLDVKLKNQIKTYLIEQQENLAHILVQTLPKLVFSQIYAVRGIVAYGILEHCLSLRCGVDFGVPGKQHPKRVAVPYEAADVPSKRSQYAQPDVSTILSYIAKYISGLDREEFDQCISKMNQLTESAQRISYKQWLEILSPEAREKLDKQDITKINMKSNSEVEEMYLCFKKCRATVAFWLNRIVFPIDLRQYTDSITASSWDIADAQFSMGFSGTKDIRWIFPAHLSWIPSQDNEIRATDAKNQYLLISQTKQIIQIPNKISSINKKQQLTHTWQKFIVKALQSDISCIIDAGAILVGKSLKNQIAPWVGQRLAQIKSNLKGITFPNQNGKWIVYDFNTKTYIDRGTRIPEHQTFVIFDQARTRGADIKMMNTVCAALTLPPNMTKDKLMQAMGRLRKIQSGQTLKIFATAEIFEKIQGLSKSKTVELKVKAIIKWITLNSVKENQKMFYHNTKLGWTHFKSKNLGMRPFIDIFNPELEVMYKNCLKNDTPYNMNSFIISKLKPEQLKILQNPVAKQQFKKVQKYGKHFEIKCQGFDDICERQVQLVQEVEEQQQKVVCTLTPLEQTQNIERGSSSFITTLTYIFNEKFLVSNNFKNCTNKHGYRLHNKENFSLKYNNQCMSILLKFQKKAYAQLLKSKRTCFQKQEFHIIIQEAYLCKNQSKMKIIVEQQDFLTQRSTQILLENSDWRIASFKSDFLMGRKHSTEKRSPTKLKASSKYCGEH